MAGDELELGVRRRRAARSAIVLADQTEPVPCCACGRNAFGRSAGISRRAFVQGLAAATAGQLETERVGEAEEIIEPNFEIAAFDSRPRLARIHGLT